MRRMLFVVNPKAGKSDIKNHLMEIIDIFIKAEWRIEIRTTQHGGHLAEIFRDEADRYDMVVCAGGDGTLNEAVNGLQNGQHNTPLGYIPVGTTNDFAVSIDLPRNAIKAAETIASGEASALDAGHLNGSCFVYVAAFGAFTKVSYETPQEFKNAFGRAAYILEGLLSLSELKGYQMTVECDDKEQLTGEFIYGMISNSTSVGGFKLPFEADMAMDDGKLELLLVRKPKNLVELNEAIGALITNDMESPYLISRQISKVIFHGEEEIAWTCDGEFGGEYKDSMVEVIPRAYQIVK